MIERLNSATTSALPNMRHFDNSWQRMWQNLHAAPPESLFEPLLAAYAQPQRHYHTQQHLAECLANFEAVMKQATRPGEVEAALWFHDAVYDVHASDNEMRSADWAEQALRQVGLPGTVIARVCALVLATAHHAAPVTADEQLLVDIDLAILGAPAERFREYETQVRQEYAWVDDRTFNTARADILDAFLARPAIYGSTHFHHLLEARARANLITAVARLRKLA